MNRLTLLRGASTRIYYDTYLRECHENCSADIQRSSSPQTKESLWKGNTVNNEIFMMRFFSWQRKSTKIDLHEKLTFVWNTVRINAHCEILSHKNQGFIIMSTASNLRNFQRLR